MFDNSYNNDDGKYVGGGRGGDDGDDHDYQPLDDGAFDAQILPQHLRVTGDYVSTTTTTTVTNTTTPFPHPHEYRELREITSGQQIVGVLFGTFVAVAVCWLAYQGRLSEQRILEGEERTRQEEIEKQSRQRDERRQAVEDLIKDNGVSTVLTEKNFRKKNGKATSRPRPTSKTDKRTKKIQTPTASSDIEMGKPETLSGAPKHGSDQGEPVVLLPFTNKDGRRDELSSSSRQLRPVEPICAICLESYRVGDVVVWSMNKGCKHVFDRDCLLDYLMKHQDGESAPCPCCRKVFLIPPDGDDKNKDDENEDIDDVNVTRDEQDG